MPCKGGVIYVRTVTWRTVVIRASVRASGYTTPAVPPPYPAIGNAATLHEHAARQLVSAGMIKTLPWVPQAPSATTPRSLRPSASVLLPMERRHHQLRSSAHARSFWHLSTTIFVCTAQVMLAVMLALRARVVPLRPCWGTVRHHRQICHPGPRRLPYHGRSERGCHDNCSDIKWLNKTEVEEPQ